MNRVFFDETEIRHPLIVGAKPGVIILASGEIFEGDQRERNVVGAFMRCARNDGAKSSTSRIAA
jgi:hypothetical protein